MTRSKCPDCAGWVADWVETHYCAVKSPSKPNLKAGRKPKLNRAEVMELIAQDPVANYFGPPMPEKRGMSDDEMATLIRTINEGNQQADLFDPNDEMRADTFGSMQ